MGGVMMSGVAPNMTVPVTGIMASDIAVGSIVKLMEGGVATEYLVVNQGKPSGSSLYDDSCDGMWLLRKDIKEERQWDSSNVNNYKKSTIHAWLNGDFFNLFGSIEQETIKQVKIPYVNGTGSGGTVSSGTNGLYTRVFLPSCYEVGFNDPNVTVMDNKPADGEKLDYFDTRDHSLRVAYLNGTADGWLLRSPHTGNTSGIWEVDGRGGSTMAGCNMQYGIRPALVLPSNAVFDGNTLILKGVA